MVHSEREMQRHWLECVVYGSGLAVDRADAHFTYLEVAGGDDEGSGWLTGKKRETMSTRQGWSAEATKKH